MKKRLAYNSELPILTGDDSDNAPPDNIAVSLNVGNIEKAEKPAAQVQSKGTPSD